MTAKKINFAEFVAMLALCMSLVALSIDTMLPALPDIGVAYDIMRLNDQQYMITFLFAGLAIGQLIAGPLSDSLGRKAGIYIGIIIFIIGSLISYFSHTYEVMLAGRFIQGLGASSPRVVTIAMVRDRYEGRDMARVMSYIMGVFILVPALAPAFGQGIMFVADWRSIFLVFIAIAATIYLWVGLRCEETLSPEDKRRFTLPVIWNGLITVCTNKMTICYTVSAGLIFGALMGYINSAQQIFQNHYNVGDMFALYFGITALTLGVAFFVNARLVRRLGMRCVVIWSLVALICVAVIFSLFEYFVDGNVPLLGFVVFMMASSFCMGMCFGNFNALAMVPMGTMAGIASSVIGAVSLVVAITLGGAVGQFYDGTLFPLTFGILGASVLALLFAKIAEGDKFLEKAAV